jgi:protein-L-isoaspartate O-methyltransferase
LATSRVAAGIDERVGDFAHAQARQSWPQRSTSNPYAGDLSILEYADRDQKLHVGRVMDLLDIAPRKSVADVGSGSG